MLRLELIEFGDNKQKIVIEVDDKSHACIKGIREKIERLNLYGGEFLVVEFLNIANPSVAVIATSLLSEMYKTVAVTERGWDCLIVAYAAEGCPFSIGQVLE